MTPETSHAASHQSDHDLLVRIDEQMKYIRIDLDLFKRDIVCRIEAAEKAISDLRISRAQLYAIAATISTLICLLIKIFWPK